MPLKMAREGWREAGPPGGGAPLAPSAEAQEGAATGAAQLRGTLSAISLRGGHNWLHAMTKSPKSKKVKFSNDLPSYTGKA